MFTRRAVSLAAASTVLAPRLALAQERADVVIVGAGLSGLNTALLLREVGLKCLVLEAGGQVGGRVRTVQTVDGTIDLGAREIGRSYVRVLDACRRFSLALVPEDRDLLTFGTHYRGAWIDSATWPSHPLNRLVGGERAIPPLLLATTLSAKYNPLRTLNDWLDPRFVSDDISHRALLQRHGHSEQAIELSTLFPVGDGVDQTSMLRTWQEDTRGRFDRAFVPFGPAPTRLAPISNIVGGAGALPRKTAASLGDAVRLNQEVVRIDVTAHGGSVSCLNGTRYQARWIVSALPFTA